MINYIANIADAGGSIRKNELYGLSNIRQTGSYGGYICNPSCWFDNGSTYTVGYKSDANNTSVIIQRFPNGDIEYKEVGTPTLPDTSGLEHAYPAVLVKDGWIYVFQVNGHGDDILIWRSTIQNDVRQGFSLYHTITGAPFGYVQPRLLDDGRIIITSRITETSEAETPFSSFSQIIIESAVNDYTNWTYKQTTTTDYVQHYIRHYPATPEMHGNNQWIYFGFAFRKQDGASNICWHGQGYYKTPATGSESCNVFYSLDENFSKDISTNGAFTLQEVQDNLVYIGSYETNQVYTSDQKGVVINDVVYGSYYDSSVSKLKFYKIESGILTEKDFNYSNWPASFPFDKNATPNSSYSGLVRIHYNGSNLVVIIAYEGGIYGIDLDLTISEELFDISSSINTDPDVEFNMAIPSNLDEVTGEYMIGGSQDADVFPYFITNDLFII